jgi:hypothetical protein
MKWVTRARPKVDRIACPWLIKRFVDPEAEFLYAPGAEVMERAKQMDAIPFHVPAAELGQHGQQIGFDAIIAKYNIADPAVKLLADIVRAADKRGSASEASGLMAIVHGFFLMHLPDDEVLRLEAPVFEALYYYCRQRVEQPT